MRGLFWVILLAALAVAVTLGARYNDGYVLLVVPPYRIELSLNLLAALAVLSFVAGYLLVRVIAHTLRLPTEVREYRERRRIERAYRLMAETLRLYFERRYAQAENAAAELLDAKEFMPLAAVIAAHCANELRAADRRDRYLARSAYFSHADQTMRAMAQAEVALEGRDPERALAALERLAHKHTGALRLELRALQLGKHWDRYLEVLASLGRAQVLDDTQLDELRRYALVQNIARKATDGAQLSAYWQRLNISDRQDPKIAHAAARSFAQLGVAREAQQIIEASLDAQWDTELARLYGDAEGADTLAQIERAEKWLVGHAADAGLLFALGRLATRQQLWGKAKSYFEAHLSVQESYQGHLQLARLFEQLGSQDQAQQHYRRSLDLVLAQRPAQGPPNA